MPCIYILVMGTCKCPRFPFFCLFEFYAEIMCNVLSPREVRNLD